MVSSAKWIETNSSEKLAGDGHAAFRVVLIVAVLMLFVGAVAGYGLR